MSASLVPAAGKTMALAASADARAPQVGLGGDVAADEVDAVAGRVALAVVQHDDLGWYSSVFSSSIRSRAVLFQPQTTMWSRNPAAPMPWPSLRRKSMTNPTTAPVMAATRATPKKASSHATMKPPGAGDVARIAGADDGGHRPVQRGPDAGHRELLLEQRHQQRRHGHEAQHRGQQRDEEVPVDLRADAPGVEATRRRIGTLKNPSMRDRNSVPSSVRATCTDAVRRGLDHPPRITTGSPRARQLARRAVPARRSAIDHQSNDSGHRRGRDADQSLLGDVDRQDAIQDRLDLVAERVVGRAHAIGQQRRRPAAAARTGRRSRTSADQRLDPERVVAVGDAQVVREVVDHGPIGDEHLGPIRAAPAPAGPAPSAPTAATRAWRPR